MTGRKKTEYIIIHCSATSTSMDIGAKEIRAMHKAKNWRDIGYHRVIKRNGTREAGRGIDMMGAHVKGYNTKSVGVVLVGGVNEAGLPRFNFTPEQMDSLAEEINELKEKYPDAKVCGHRDMYGDINKDGVIDSRDWMKECPCFSVDTFLKERGIVNVVGS